MKLLILACDISMTDRVTDILLKENIGSWQVIEDIKGKLPGMLPHMDTPVWPGHNTLFLIQSTEKETDRIFAACRSLNAESINNDEKIHGWNFEIFSFLNN